MKRISLLVAGCLCLSLAVLAGTVITNDTGEDAYGLRVTFSSPVIITGFGDAFTNKKAEDLSYVYLFSGGVVPPMGTIWFNHAPSPASVVTTEWLSQDPNVPSTAYQLSDDVVSPTSYVAEESFDITLVSDTGESIEARVTRRQSVERIPFWVEYEVEDLGEEIACLWIMERPIVLDEVEVQHADGHSVRFVATSNAKDHKVELLIRVDDQSYSWEETIDFPLHSRTEILLDASQFGSSESASVLWSAHNWAPDDVVTFPIADPSSASTSMTSKWPNVIYVSCEIESEVGNTTDIETEALVYWRDGPPFEIRGIMAMYQGGLTNRQLAEVMDQEFPLLQDLGANLIVHQHREWFDAPDQNGDFDIHPLYRTWSSTWPEEGYTPPLDQLSTYITRAAEEGFAVHVELRQANYPSISSEYHQSGWGSEEGFMGTSGWLGAYRDYFERTVSFFAGLKDEDGNEVVSSMTLSAEKGWLEDRGGRTIRDFQRELLYEIRDPSPDNPMYFSGPLSYAHSYYQSEGSATAIPLNRTLLDPAECGIYWEGFDRLETTFYPTLTHRLDSTLQELVDEMVRQTKRYLIPWSDAYGGKPIFLEDVQCSAVRGAAIWPTSALHMDDPFSPAEQLNYFAAIVRGIAIVNRDRQIPLFEGLSMGYYHLGPDEWLIALPAKWNIKQPYVNDANNRRDLQLFMKAYYVDKPLFTEAW